MAILGILSDCRSAKDLERFARRHRQAFNQALGLDLTGAPCDSTFLYLSETDRSKGATVYLSKYDDLKRLAHCR